MFANVPVGVYILDMDNFVICPCYCIERAYTYDSHRSEYYTGTFELFNSGPVPMTDSRKLGSCFIL